LIVVGEIQNGGGIKILTCWK